MRAMPIRSSRLDQMPDSELLRMRFCDLPLGLKGSVIEQRAKLVFDELKARDIRFRPSIWIAEEWYNPDGVVGFAIPFYLLHPRLIRLERKLMLEAEGVSVNDAMSILRHETGHAVDEAFQLREMREYRQVFGSPQRAYPTDYVADFRQPRFRTASQRLVRAVSPGRRFCRDVCRLAEVGTKLASDVSRLARI